MLEDSVAQVQHDEEAGRGCSNRHQCPSQDLVREDAYEADGNKHAQSVPCRKEGSPCWCRQTLTLHIAGRSLELGGV